MSTEQGVYVDGVLKPSNPRTTQRKRAACDRCRSQKLRCLREARGGNFDAGKCVRCNTAGAVCSFSASRRAGRRPASATVNNAERKTKAKCTQGGQASKKARTDLLNNAFDDITLESQYRRVDKDLPAGNAFLNEVGIDTALANSADELSSQTLDPSPLLDTSWSPLADMPWMNEVSAPHCDHANLANPVSLDAFIQDYGWSFPTNPSNGVLSQVHTPGFTKNQATTNCAAPNKTISDHHPLGMVSESLDPRLTAQRTKSEEDMAHLKTRESSSKSSSSRLKSETSPVPSHDSDPHHQQMQDLSELSMNLYSQVMANEEYHQAQLSTGVVVPCEQLVGGILSSSASFLKLLGSFYPSSANKFFKDNTSISESSDGEISPSETSTSSGFSDFATSVSATTTSDYSQKYSNYQWKLSVPASSLSYKSPQDRSDKQDAKKPLKADMATVLQLLTCYIRIIHLHSLFYTQVYDCLTASPTVFKTPLPPIFPNLHVGCLALDEFPNFQVKLLLQISTHVLGEIEKALGLPEGYRISKKDPQSQGILEANVSSHFVEMTMRENMRTGLVGIEKDRVKSIRDKLGSLRVLLKGSITI